MRTMSKAVAAGLFTLALAGCAGTPPASEQQAAASTKNSSKCIPSTGSMFCDTGTDQDYGSLNGPNGSAPRGNQSLSAQGLGGK